eukprot:PITA_30363
MTKNETQHSIGILITDNGGDYTSHVFEQYLQHNGIKHHTILPYNPQKKNVAKRINRTLLNMVRSTMFFKNAKLILCGEAVPFAAYIRNRCPPSVINNKYPYEMWGVPILDQSVVLPSLTHQNVIAEEKLDDSNVSAAPKISLEEPIFQDEQPSQPLEQPLQRSTLARKVPIKYDDFETGMSCKVDSGNVSHDYEFNHCTISEPNFFQEVTNCDESKNAMQKKYDALIQNGTWSLVDPPAAIKPIGCKWVYKIKYKDDGLLDNYKARLAAKGYAQKEGINYIETFALTAK